MLSRQAKRKRQDDADKAIQPFVDLVSAGWTLEIEDGKLVAKTQDAELRLSKETDDA